MSPHLGDHDFGRLRDYIHKLCGLHISLDKRYLIEQRLESLAAETSPTGFKGLCEILAKNPTPRLNERIIAAITTNETSFFRDIHPFDSFREHLLPAMVEKIRHRRSFRHEEQPYAASARIWSAGASTGQEPYSIAIIIHEFLREHPELGIRPEDFEILATDISTRVLEQAIAGRYNEVEILRGLTPEQRDAYFIQEGKDWFLTQEIRHMVSFQRMNLTATFTPLGSFDCIFCRNVLIYFDDGTKRAILRRLYDKLEPDGHLVLGSAENLYGVSDLFYSHQSKSTLLYCKKN